MALLKIDENMPPSAATMLAAAGHECHSVYDEKLAGAKDTEIAAACRREGRILITMDTDFANIRVYPPGSHPGIVVLRPHEDETMAILSLLARVVAKMKSEPVDGNLWICTDARIRVRPR